MATHPSVFLGLLPPAATGDEALPDETTNAGHAVTMVADGTYDCPGATSLEFFSVSVFDDSEGEDHEDSPFRVYVGGSIRAPGLISNTQAAATTTLTGLGLNVVTENGFSDVIPVGRVIAQRDANDVDIAAGTLVVSGMTIKLVIAVATQAAVPNLLGLSTAAAVSAIEFVDLVAAFGDPQYNDTVAAGLILSQTPAPGANVAIGSTVTIVASLGPLAVPAMTPKRRQFEVGRDVVVEARVRPGTIVDFEFDWRIETFRFHRPGEAYTVGTRLRVDPENGFEYAVTTGGQTSRARTWKPSTTLNETKQDGSVSLRTSELTLSGLLKRITGSLWTPSTADAAVTEQTIVDSPGQQKTRVLLTVSGASGNALDVVNEVPFTDGTKIKASLRLTIDDEAD